MAGTGRLHRRTGGEYRAKTEARKSVKCRQVTGSALVATCGENGLARRRAKTVLEDLFDVVSVGVMRGERVALEDRKDVHQEEAGAQRARWEEIPDRSMITIRREAGDPGPRFISARHSKNQR